MERSLVHFWLKASVVEDRAYARWIIVLSKLAFFIAFVNVAMKMQQEASIFSI